MCNIRFFNPQALPLRIETSPHKPPAPQRSQCRTVPNHTFQLPAPHGAPPCNPVVVQRACPTLRFRPCPQLSFRVVVTLSAGRQSARPGPARLQLQPLAPGPHWRHSAPPAGALSRPQRRSILPTKIMSCAIFRGKGFKGKGPLPLNRSRSLQRAAAASPPWKKPRGPQEQTLLFQTDRTLIKEQRAKPQLFLACAAALASTSCDRFFMFFMRRSSTRFGRPRGLQRPPPPPPPSVPQRFGLSASRLQTPTARQMQCSRTCRSLLVQGSAGRRKASGNRRPLRGGGASDSPQLPSVSTSTLRTRSREERRTRPGKEEERRGEKRRASPHERLRRGAEKELEPRVAHGMAVQLLSSQSSQRERHGKGRARQGRDFGVGTEASSWSVWRTTSDSCAKPAGKAETRHNTHGLPAVSLSLRSRGRGAPLSLSWECRRSRARIRRSPFSKAATTSGTFRKRPPPPRSLSVPLVFLFLGSSHILILPPWPRRRRCASGHGWPGPAQKQRLIGRLGRRRRSAAAFLLSASSQLSQLSLSRGLLRPKLPPAARPPLGTPSSGRPSLPRKL